MWLNQLWNRICNRIQAGLCLLLTIYFIHWMLWYFGSIKYFLSLLLNCSPPVADPWPRFRSGSIIITVTIIMIIRATIFYSPCLMNNATQLGPFVWHFTFVSRGLHLAFQVLIIIILPSEVLHHGRLQFNFDEFVTMVTIIAIIRQRQLVY